MIRCRKATHLDQSKKKNRTVHCQEEHCFIRKLQTEVTSMIENKKAIMV